MQGRISVIDTSPTSSGINVPTSSTVSIRFDKDISKKSLAGNVYMIDAGGVKVDAIISSANREVTITPRELLKASTTYMVVVKGNNNPDNLVANAGVTSPIGEYLLGDYTYSFSTVSPLKETELVINIAPDNVLLTVQPTFKGEVTDDVVATVKYIDIEIASSNMFEAATIIWSGRCLVDDFKNGVAKCDKFLDDGAYYWRARTVCNVNGEWCNFATFSIQTHGDATVVAEDHVDIDVSFPESWDMIEAKIIEAYPENNRSNVKTNLKSLYLVIDKIVPEEELCYSNIRLTGEDVDGGYADELHVVDMASSVVYDHEHGTTVIILDLPIYSEEEE